MLLGLLGRLWGVMLGLAVVVFRVLSVVYCCFAFYLFLIFLKGKKHKARLQFGLTGVFLGCFQVSWDVFGVLFLALLQLCFVFFHSFAVFFALDLFLIPLNGEKRETPLQFGLTGVLLGCFWVSWDVFGVLFFALLQSCFVFIFVTKKKHILIRPKVNT